MFRVGNQVRVKANGCIGQIVKIDIREEYCIYVSWESGGMSFKASEIELVNDQKRKFQIGDQVQNIKPGTLSYLKFGKVIDLIPYRKNGNIKVKIGGGANWFVSSSLKLIKEVHVNNKFKIGDKVQMNTSFLPIKGKITKTKDMLCTNNHLFDYEITEHHGQTWYVRESEIKLIKEVHVNKFKIGDKVYLKGDVGYVAGEIISSGCGKYLVNWSNKSPCRYAGSPMKYEEDELVMANKFQIGDKVRTNANCVTYQAEGVVVEYNSYGLVGYAMNGGGLDIYYEPENKLDLIKEVPMTKFQISDRVRVVDDLDNNPRLFIGCTGCISEINICVEFGVEYHIDLDNGYDLWATDGEIQDEDLPYAAPIAEMMMKVGNLSMDNASLRSELDATQQRLNQLMNDFNDQGEELEGTAKELKQLYEVSSMLSDKHQHLADLLRDVDVQDLLRDELQNAVDTHDYTLVAKLSVLLDK